jgi:choline dehydrogenase
MKAEADTYDYIVIGAGSAGCAVAGRLAENPNCSVLLLEAGGRDTSPLLKIPGGVRMTIGSPKYDWRLHAEPDPTRNGRADFINRGKVLGGSSAINGMIYHRGPASDYDALARDAMPGWAWADVLPFFKLAEDFEGGQSPSHGVGGPLGVSYIRTPHFLSQQFLSACAEARLPVLEDINGGADVGIGYVHCTQRNGARDSAAQAYLHRKRRPNLHILTHAHATRILFDQDRRATGVAFLRHGQPAQAQARRELILSAGSIMTPHLLMHSGIGPADELRRLGIDVLVDRPDVGANFHDHLDVDLKYEVNQSTFNMKTDIFNMLRYGGQWLMTRDGPVASPGAQIAGLFKSNPDLDRPDFYIFFQPNGYRIEPGKIVFNREPTVTFYAGVANPKSRGRVGLSSPDPKAPPSIAPRMLDHEDDARAILAGLRMGRTLMQTEAMRPYIVRELEPGPGVQTDEALMEYIRANAEPVLHCTGTARMGVDGASIVDMSIFAGVPSANTNAVAIMVGERCAHFIKQGGAYRQ